MQIITSWDDGDKLDLKLTELLVKYNLTGIFYLPWLLDKSHNLSRVKEFLTKKDCLEIAKTQEIGSHTVSHQFLTRILLEQAEQEIKESRKLWQEFTGQKIASFCYPRGYANEQIIKFVEEAGYTSARNTKIGNLKESPNPFWTDTTVHVGINRQEYNGQNWKDYAFLMLNKCRETDGIYHLFGHSWEIEQNNAWNDLEDLFKEINGR